MLTETLSQLEWKVRRGSNLGSGAGVPPGLSLVASPLLNRQRLSRTFTALSRVGAPITLRLDDHLGANETRLLLGSLLVEGAEANEANPMNTGW
jgi:hypothetical protein